MAAVAVGADDRPLYLSAATGQGYASDVDRSRCATRLPECEILLPPSAFRLAVCGCCTADCRLGPSSRGIERYEQHDRRNRYCSGDRRIEQYVGTGFSARPDLCGQGDGGQVHYGPSERPDRIGRLRWREFYTESVDYRQGVVGQHFGYDPQRNHRGRYGDRKRFGNGNQPVAGEPSQKQSDHPVDRWCEQQRPDRSADCGGYCQNTWNPGLHDRRG